MNIENLLKIGFPNNMLSSMIVRYRNENSGDKVTLFEHTEYGGRNREFDIGIYSCEDFSKLNFHDVTSSILVPKGLKATVYQHCFDGEQETFEGLYENDNFRNNLSPFEN